MMEIQEDEHSPAVLMKDIKQSVRNAAMIECEDMEFYYPCSTFRLLVKSLQVLPGEAVALVGPSGSGKSTLLNLFSGVCRPASGKLRVDGTPLSELSESRRRRFRLERVGYVFQAFELFDHLTARENILFPMGAAGRLGREKQRFDAELARLVEAAGLSGQLEQRVGTLSRGEQQRAALCRALVHRPRLVLADEPTGNLDPSNKRVAMALMRELVSERNATLIVATHDDSLLADFDRVIDVHSLGTAA